MIDEITKLLEERDVSYRVISFKSKVVSGEEAEEYAEASSNDLDKIKDYIVVEL